MIEIAKSYITKMGIKSEKELTSNEKGMLAVYNRPVDFKMRKNINEIITYINS